MPRNTKIPDSKTKTIIKDMLSSVGVTLVKAVEERNAMFPDSASSAQNISNKLQRETISFIEVVELAEALGLKIKWVPVCDDEPEVEFISRNPSENEEKEFKEIASAGFESVESVNFRFSEMKGTNCVAAFLNGDTTSNFSVFGEIQNDGSINPGTYTGTVTFSVLLVGKDDYSNY